jgi:hypothetical protein
MLRNARMRLKREGVLQRAFVVNAFLAGPTSMIEKPEGLEKTLDHLLGNIQPRNRALARDMAKALLRSQGDMKSMAVAFILAQKPEKEGQSLSEGEILRSLFEAFGAGGIKLGQYLAFTSEMGPYQKALAKLQDAALPVSYLEAVRLIQSRFPDGWVLDYEVVGVLGTGSVNVAVEYIDKTTNEKKSKVVSILRKDIEVATAEDFRKLHAFVAELGKLDAGLPVSAQRFSHLPGLLRIIQESVSLEFDKDNALAVQTRAVALYRRTTRRYKLQTIAPHWARNGTLDMDKAPGVTAVKLRESNPAVYREAMRLVLREELDILFGVDESGKAKPVPLFANPDIHDGQVVIDPDEKIIPVTVLDFGQALPITNEQREVGVEFLRILGDCRGADRLRELLGRIGRRLDPRWDASSLSAEDLGQILARTDRMDRMVYLLGMVEQKGLIVPLPVVHWLLGVNRAVQLGKNVGVNVELKIGGLLVARRAGLGVEFFNAMRLFARAIGGG